ncbi:DUF3883 domain-containing protein [Lysobacter auxotrophicus]|uniref:DUF3883 domain-containing protein n=1 Tax=Lysobacter auxotrophicus TaxID=2992573 RepID=A0ABM8DI04_9GAMM|nr:DUF3883 domain-containing protein [Lysobacter auxotrophicus]BDU18276.1 DUF3883 domain-containing protein [Lysobacter auxotrophicus]
MDLEQGETGEPWTRREVEATVTAYFQMLRMQELGQRLNKAEHNRRLLEKLPARNLKAIEYKHRNISAVMNLYGAQMLSGYRPATNFQQLLVDVVGQTLAQDRAFDEAAIRSVETPAEVPVLGSFEDFLVEAPKVKERVQEQRAEWIRRAPVKRDYLERESRNRSLGLAGELLVMEYEARRLHEEGAKRFADRIEHVSQVRGDGTGYDILSFDADGRERFIEVKTTAYMAETPFFVTPNEVDFSSEQFRQFHLYRLFAFRKRPRMFVLTGPVAANCHLEANGFRATVMGIQPPSI